ncbi:glycosyl transferase family 1 [Roseibium aquae]|uniref:Glycosyl transferase family 1 n=1 Tax=Roseibium aquae TaxID=1323746 RepID=A0A916X0W1_9HYPH|nr:glycosyltransferase family 4 protein [Roseibium aquae]GGB48456.1 glycosyl transferase family 1 [Roseibium aquae]
MSEAFDGMRIVHVVRQFAPRVGGLEDMVRNLARSQLGRFASVEVVTLDRLFTMPDRRLPARETIDGIAVTRIPYSGLSRYPFAPQVFRHLAEADLVHVHGVDFFFDALALGRGLHGKPLVATTHGGFFHTQTFRRLKLLWLNTLTRLSIRQYGVIACCGANDFKIFQPIAGSRCRLIENGVDIAKFAGASPEKPVKGIVSIGRFSVNKRLDRLLDAMACLTAQDPDWHLHIVGAPADLTAADLHREIAARELANHVSVHAGASTEHVRDLLSRVSVFASASEYEGFGLAAIEALSAGLPTVVHPNASFSDLARRHDAMHLVDYSCPQEAAAAITRVFGALSGQPSLRDEAMRSARQHDWRQASAAYEDLYREVLGAGSPGAGKP